MKRVIVLPLMIMMCVASMAVSLSAKSGGSQKHDGIRVEKEREREMALSAAPDHLRGEAGVYVLESKGYVKERESKNGFNCLILRGGNVLAPICYDAEGSETNMIADMRKAELSSQGKSDEQVQKIIEEEYRSGKLLAPRRPGVAYMLSTEFKAHDSKTGKSKQVFVPHVMFYAPYLKNSDIGSLPQHTNSHSQLFIISEGKPDAYIIVVPKGDHSHKDGGR